MEPSSEEDGQMSLSKSSPTLALSLPSTSSLSPAITPTTSTNLSHSPSTMRDAVRKRLLNVGSVTSPLELSLATDSLHHFKRKYFSELTWCSLCKEFIWGVHKKQGYKCSGASLRISLQLPQSRGRRMGIPV